MAKELQNEASLQGALLRCGDAAFRMAYMHTKVPGEAREILQDVFMQYALSPQSFKNEDEERFWILKITHQHCMDFYSKKLRKKLADAQIQHAGHDLPFLVSDELCAIMKLPYTVLSALALCRGEGETPEYAARVTGCPVSILKKRLNKAIAGVKMSGDDLDEWIRTIQMPDDLYSRIPYYILNESKDKHFSINSKAKTFKRRLDRAIPYIALGVLVFGIFCVVALRSGWLGVEYFRSPSILPDTEISAAGDDGESHVTLEESASAAGDTLAKLDISVYVPDDFGLIQYNVSDMDGDLSAVMAKMAEKGAFPADVVLEDVHFISGGEVVSTLKSGEMLEVRLYFSDELQEYLNSAATTASLEAIAKTVDSFYDAANMNLSKLEIYSCGQRVTVNGETADCSALIYGDLQISSVIEE